MDICLKCDTCAKDVDLLFKCPFCSGNFCIEHRLPHKHYCPSISRDDLISEVISKAAPSETLLDPFLFAATMVAYAFIVAVVVLAIDAVVLLLLDLWNAHTWLNLLWWEGIALASIGAVAGYYHREAPVPWATPMGTRLYRIKWAVRKPLFWASFGIAGLILLLIAFLVWQFH